MSKSNGELTAPLCLSCGICCNGVLFKDVRLQPSDDAEQLRALGLPLTRRRAGSKKASSAASASYQFPQPCQALGCDCRCRIYADRPGYCRAFECALFKNVAAGRIEVAAALRIIRATLERADQVQRLLAQLGDTEKSVALSVRFRRMRRRIEAGGLDGDTARIYGELSLAFHNLNMLLSESFYPDPTD